MWVKHHILLAKSVWEALDCCSYLLHPLWGLVLQPHQVPDRLVVMLTEGQREGKGQKQTLCVVFFFFK